MCMCEVLRAIARNAECVCVCVRRYMSGCATFTLWYPASRSYTSVVERPRYKRLDP